MNNQQNNQESNSAEHPSKVNDDASKVNIQPSEPETGSAERNEENAPGRTPGKAEGSSEIVEADLADGKD
jgi:hypothetical protein